MSADDIFGFVLLALFIMPFLIIIWGFAIIVIRAVRE
jgi:hypothetical protein